MTINIQDAVKRSIRTAKNAVYFYSLGAKMMQDQAAKELFEQLARDEREHAEHLYGAYQGTDIPSLETYLNTPPDHEAIWYASISRLVENNFSEQKAMELAMKRERHLEKTLLENASKVSDPEVRAILELNARKTRDHYLLIESDYARMMGMVNELDMDIFVRE